jgi:proline dehydrogenase
MFRRFASESWVGKRVAHRFVAGQTLEGALEAARWLNRRAIASMFDHLGENVTNPEQASAATDAYVLALKRIGEADDLDCDISIKLTQLGLDLSYELCIENAERVLSSAAERGTLVMIDMESHEYVDRTLRAHRDLRTRFANVGVCLQSYLYRTAEEVFSLPDGSIIRLAKGAYLEPADVAFPRRRDVDRSFARLFATLLSRGHVVHVATHDPSLLQGAVRSVEQHGHQWDRVELQFLYGIRTDLQNRYAQEGFPVRVYIPYGSEWYPYLTRRLAERPANLWFFLSNLVRVGER